MVAARREPSGFSRAGRLAPNGIHLEFAQAAPALAPTGLSISQIDITATNNLATDDWAFIVAPAAVLEPGSFALLAMMGATAALRRRKR